MSLETLEELVIYIYVDFMDYSMYSSIIFFMLKLFLLHDCNIQNTNIIRISEASTESIAVEHYVQLFT